MLGDTEVRVHIIEYLDIVHLLRLTRLEPCHGVGLVEVVDVGDEARLSKLIGLEVLLSQMQLLVRLAQPCNRLIGIRPYRL